MPTTVRRKYGFDGDTFNGDGHAATQPNDQRAWTILAELRDRLLKAIALTYSLISAPALITGLLAFVAISPSLFGFYGDSLAGQIAAGLAAMHADARLELVLAGAQALILLVTAALILYGIGNAVRSLVQSLWRWGGQRRQRRALSLVALAALIALLSVAWRPQLATLVPHFAQVVQQILHGS